MLKQHLQDPSDAQTLTCVRAVSVATEHRAQNDQTPCPSEAESVESILEMLDQERRSQKRRTQLLQRVVFAFYGLLLLMTIGIGLKTGRFPWEMLSSMSGVGAISAGAMASRRQKTATQWLAKFEDIRAVGPLAEALQFSDRQIHAVAAATLIKLLPRLKANDAPLLTDEQRKILCRALYRGAFGFNIPLALAILKGFEQVGGKGELPAVQRLAERPVRSRTDKQVTEAAQQCLPFLQQRTEQERARQMLLRASSPSAAAPDMLLRPAVGGAVVERRF